MKREDFFSPFRRAFLGQSHFDHVQSNVSASISPKIFIIAVELSELCQEIVRRVDEAVDATNPANR